MHATKKKTIHLLRGDVSLSLDSISSIEAHLAWTQQIFEKLIYISRPTRPIELENSGPGSKNMGVVCVRVCGGLVLFLFFLLFLLSFSLSASERKRTTINPICHAMPISQAPPILIVDLLLITPFFAYKFF